MSLRLIADLDTSGAIMPTGRKVTEEVTHFIDGNEKCIVEIGPGTGVFTQKVLEKNSACDFICLEINKVFVDIMQNTYPTVHTYHDSATEIELYIKKHDHDVCNRVISGLPWVSFSTQLQGEIMEAVHRSLEADGTFSTFAYTGIHMLPKGKHFSGLLSDIFGPDNIQKSRTFKSNTPPAFVYHCTKK